VVDLDLCMKGMDWENLGLPHGIRTNCPGLLGLGPQNCARIIVDVRSRGSPSPL